MTRVRGARDHCEQAHRRARTERDRNGKGGRHWNGRPPQKNFDQHQHPENIYTDSVRQADIDFFRKHGDLIRLRQSGKTFEEIANEIAGSRLDVFKTFQMISSTKLRIELGIPR